MWRETLARSLGSRDAAELVDGMCHGDDCPKIQPASTPYLPQIRDGPYSPTIGFSTRHWLDPFARAKSNLVLKINGRSEGEVADKTAD